MVARLKVRNWSKRQRKPGHGKKKPNNVNFLWPGGVFERFEENFGGQIKSGDQSGEKYSLMTMTNKTPCMHRRSSYYQMDPI